VDVIPFSVVLALVQTFVSDCWSTGFCTTPETIVARQAPETLGHHNETLYIPNDLRLYENSTSEPGELAVAIQ
jgi:hypothetical protein